MATKENVLAAYEDWSGPAVQGYFPKWVNNLADDAVLEGSLLKGPVQGKEAIRSIVLAIRSLYERQQHKYAGPCGDRGFLEDYVADVRGKPIGCVLLATQNADGKTQHVVASYRPLRSLLLLSRLLREEKFAGTPYAEQFASKVPEPLESDTDKAPEGQARQPELGH
jgi:hypothetical protein